MHFLQAINSDISVLIVCNKTGGTIKGDIKKKKFRTALSLKLGKSLSVCHLKWVTMVTWCFKELNL